jgi:PKD repeat protein
LTFNGNHSSDPDGTIVSYAWNFGDGGTANGANVSHTYNAVGSYNVVLTVVDDDGLSDTSTYTVLIEQLVTNQPPVARINGPDSTLVGQTVVFDSGGSHDPDGTIDSYVWDFGDGASHQARSGESTVAHTYNSAGTYQVRLTVTDNGGLSDTATHTIVVQEPAPNQAPIARINGPDRAMVGETVVFDSGNSHDPDGMILS